MTPRQAARIAAVFTPLGEDQLLLRRMLAVEQVSGCFALDLQLISEQFTIGFEDLIGQGVTVRCDLPQARTRYFNGLVTQFSYLGSEGRNARYQARVSPWLWYLTRAANCRIFQQKTVPKIIEEVFSAYDASEFENKLTADYRTWEYCVQYRETDFNFVSRLMEQEGIHYYFRHSDGKHTMVLADCDSPPQRFPGYDQVPYYPPEDTQRRERDNISEWSVLQEVRSGKHSLRDFDFEKPKVNLEARRLASPQKALADVEVYDFPGVYLTRDEGEVCSRIRLEESLADQELVRGAGDVGGLSPGYVFALTNCPREDQNREYRVISTILEVNVEEYETRAADEAAPAIRCSFTGIGGKRPYRPPRGTPKPVVQGPQTAIVTGPEGQEIWTDKYGRVKVQFHWDRDGQYDENSSCWVRVSQPWAGKGWGAVTIPRIGQEVIVEFLEGDPDRPIITGRVYNADTMPPYGLPAGAVQSGIKSSTHKGQGYNEYVMDDTAGNELIREHAQFNKDTTVENDKKLTVHNNRTSTIDIDDTESIGNNQSITIGVDQTQSIGSNQTEAVGANKTVTVAANHTESVGANQTITVGSTKTERIGVIYALTVGAAMNQTVGAALAQEVGGAKLVEIGGAYVLGVGAVMSETVGASKSSKIGSGLSETIGGAHNEKVTGAYLLKAAQVKVQAPKIVLVAGGSKITMDSSGISIKAPKISLNASGNISIKAGGTIKEKSATIGEN